MSKPLPSTKIFYSVLLFVSLLCFESLAQRVRGRVFDASSGRPLLGASVTVENNTTGMNTSITGQYSLRIGTGTYRLRVSMVGYQTTVLTFRIGTADLAMDVPLQASFDALGEVVVIGSRSTTSRSNTDTPAPIDTFTGDNLMATGQTEPTQMLNFVAPSFNSARQTVADGTDHIDPATLRGLGPDQVLVLINGKRRHTTALVNVNGTVGRGSVGTDLNAIPTAAIERIEVLRDGAAAQYGSDAIAGIVNVVMKDETGKTSLTAHAGKTYTGDGGTMQYGLYHGFKIGKGGHLSVAADYRFRQPTNRVGTYTGFVYRTATQDGKTEAENRTLDNALIQQNGFSRENNMAVGNSQVQNLGVLVNVGLPITKATEFYLTANYNHRNGQAAGFYRYPNQPRQVDLTLYPNGFLPEIHSAINDRSVLMGVQGVSQNGWRYDLSNVYGGNSFKFDVKNSMNASLGASSPKDFYAGTLAFNQNTTNLNLAKDFAEEIGLQSFNVALGGEFRLDNYQIKAGEEASYSNNNPPNTPSANLKAAGAQVFPGFQPANALNKTRTIYGGYLDVETDLSEWLLVSAAARYENYSDFGNNLATKVAARIKLSETFALRGNYSNGFRAPSMHQRYFNAVSTVFVNSPTGLVPLQQGTFNNESPVAQAFGIPSLKAETSRSYSVGITARPTNALNVTIDAYEINIQDRIVLTGSFPKSTPAVGRLLAAFPDVNSAVFFTNAISTRTRGLDVIVAYGTKFNKNTSFDLTAAANFNQTKIIGDAQTTDKLPAADFANVLFNREERGRIEQGQPRNKIMVSGNLKVGIVGLMVRTTRFGEVAALFNGTDLTRDEYFSPKTITDVSLMVKPIKIMTLTVGANNVLDVYPDKIQNPLNASDGRFVYSRNATQFGFNGGYYFVNLAVNF